MKTVTKPINVTIGGTPKTLGFHTVNYGVFPDTKTISGTVQSFVDNTVVNNMVNGRMTVAKVSQFNIPNADMVNYETALSTYIDANIDTIVATIPTQGR